MSKWDERFMAIATQVASWSKDPDEGVGCVIVSPDKRQVAWGYNGFPAGVSDDYSAHDKQSKNRLILHAEDNAMANAEHSVAGWVMYVTKAPCFECCKRVIQKRIGLVVRPPISDLSTWFKDQAEGSRLLLNAGVRQVVIGGKDQA